MNALTPTVDATARQFLAGLWGADADGGLPGVHFIVERKAGGWVHHPVNDVTEAADIAEKTSAAGGDAYFACSEFKTEANRKASNAVGARGFWADIDCGPGKPYEDQRAGIEALKAFVKATGLPPPTFVNNSGNGLHVYWTLEERLPAAKWIERARKLKRLMEIYGFDADPARTADLSSILRVPGTHNHKDAANPRPVVVFHPRGGAPRRINLADFEAALERAMAAEAAPVSPEFTAGLPCNISRDRLPPSRERFQSALAALPHNLPYHKWRDAIWSGIASGFPDAVDLLREWSQQSEWWDKPDSRGKMGWENFDQIVASYDPTRPNTKGVGSFFYLAQQHDWNGATAPVDGEIIAPGAALPGQLATLEDFNRRFFVSMIGGGCFIFDERAENPIASAMSEASFKLRFKNVRSEDNSLPAIWLSWTGRRTYDAVDFDPRGECTPGVFNSYRGLAVEPRAGACDLILAHIRDVLCGGDDAQFRYVIRWMALLVQCPWIKPEVALVLRSCEGAGKSIIAGVLLKIFGQHGFTTSSKDAVAGRFNAHLRDKIFVVLEEAFFAGDPQAVAAAKVLVTNPVLSYEAKCKDAVTGRNFAHVVMMTNSAWAVPAGEDARRWCVLDVSDARVGDHAYFERLAAQIRDGGVEAFLEYLLKFDLTGFNPRKLPQTAALADQRRETLLHDKPVDAWVFDALVNDEFPLKDGNSLDWADEVDGGALRSSYEHATAKKPRAPIWSQAMIRFRELVGAVGTSRPRGQLGRKHVYRLPSLDEARAKFRKVTGVNPVAE